MVSGLEHPDRDKQETTIDVDGAAEAQEALAGFCVP